MNPRLPLALLLALVLAACGESEQSSSSERATPITATEVQERQVERAERAIGRLRASTAPAVAAETVGRIIAIHADAGDEVEAGAVLAEIDAQVQRIAVNAAQAEIRRLQAMLENERRRVRRLSDLAEQQSVAQDQLDEARTGVESLEAQLESARSRLENAEYNLKRTQITSPVTGRVETRLVSEGDFVDAGVRVFDLVSFEALQAFVPLPEHLQDQVGLGQPVRLSIPARPDDALMAEVSDLRPAIGAGSRAIELIVDIDNPGGWRPGGSVTADVILEQHDGVVVPPTSVVHRPSGQVVYVLEGERVSERAVSVGLRGDGWTEIVEGVEAGERVAVDGAGFLTDGARVAVQSDGESS